MNQFVVFELVWQTSEYCSRCKKVVYSVGNEIMTPFLHQDTIIRIIGPNSEEVKDIFIKRIGDLIPHHNIIPLRERVR